MRSYLTTSHLSWACATLCAACGIAFFGVARTERFEMEARSIGSGAYADPVGDHTVSAESSVDQGVAENLPPLPPGVGQMVSSSFADAGYVRFRLPLDSDSTNHYFYDHDTASTAWRNWFCQTGTSGYGSYDTHTGTDYPASRSTAIKAAAAGKILSKVDAYGDQGGGTCGNYVWLNHGNGLITKYCHMTLGSVTKKAVGSDVACGETIGGVGMSGHADGLHLHFAPAELATEISFDPYAGICNVVTSSWVSQDPQTGTPTTSCQSATPVSPAISIISPNVGDQWQPGSVHSVVWSTFGTINPSQLYFASSVNGGQSWTTPTAIPTNASYGWTLPSTSTTTARVFVGNIVNGAWQTWAMSSNFTIVAACFPGSNGSGTDSWGHPMSLAACGVTPSVTLTAKDVSQTSVATNQAFSVNVTLRVDSATAEHAGISISFPSLTSVGKSGSSYSSSQGAVSTSSISSGASQSYLDGAVDSMLCNPGTTCTEKHLLAEADWANVSAGSSKTFNLNVTPKQAGSFKVRIRAWVTTNNYSNVWRDPSAGSVDQQNFWIYEYTVSVSNPTSAPTVITNAATGIGQTTATIGATVNPNGVSTALDFNWGQNTTYGFVATYGNVGSGISNTTRTYDFTGLSCATTYHYQAHAQNTGGSVLGGDQSFTTSACSSPSIALNTTSMTFTAQQGGGGPLGQELAISSTSGSLNWSLAASTAWISMSGQSGSTPGRVSIFADTGNLLAGTYQGNVSVSASGAANSPRTVAVTFVVSPPPPPAVTTGSATAISQTGAIVSATVNPNGLSTTLSFDYGLTSNYGSSVDYGSVGSGTQPVDQLKSINGLVCGTPYHFRARAQSSSGTVNGDDKTFTTTACPVALTVSSITGTGSVTSSTGGIDCPASSCAASFVVGTTVTLTAAPGSGWLIWDWSGFCPKMATTCSLLMDQPRVLSLTFKRAFADNQLTSGVSPVKAVHITELRSRIDALRIGRGLGSFLWTDPNLSAGNTPMKAVHITELRTALLDVYQSLGLSDPVYTHLSIVSGAAVAASDISELRIAVLTIEWMASTWPGQQTSAEVRQLVTSRVPLKCPSAWPHM